MMPEKFFDVSYAMKNIRNPYNTFYYQRANHPLAEKFEKEMAKLENGAHCLSFSWGMSAIHTLLFEMLKNGDRIMINRDLYHGTTKQCLEWQRFGVETDIVDMRDLQQVADNLKPETRIVFFETPSNPRLWLVDVEAVSKLVHEKNPDCLVVVDNTFCTPFIQIPLFLGADFVVHSTTKMISGHGNTGGGVVVSNLSLERLKRARANCGTIQKPMDSFLHIKQIQTLALRMWDQSVKAKLIAEELERKPGIERVTYPSLESFPQKDLAKKQMTVGGEICGGVVMAFYIKGDLEKTIKFVENLTSVKVCVSTGSLETMIQIPAMPENLIRLSVGAEDPSIFLNDVDIALEII